jgi:hypothetical protein
MDPLSSNPNAPVCQEPDADQTAATTGPTPPPLNHAEAWRKPMASFMPCGDDSALERNVRATLADLGAKESLELNLNAELKSGLSGAGKLKVRVERQSDGTFETAVTGQLEGGEGPPGVAARMGAAGTIKLKARTEAEAADQLDSLLKASLPAPVGDGARLLQRAGVKSDEVKSVADATARLLGHAGQVAEVRGEVLVAAEVGEKFGASNQGANPNAGFEASTKLRGESRLGFTVNFDKRELTVSSVPVSVSGEASAGITIPGFGKVAGAGRSTVTLESTIALSAKDAEALKRGELDVGELIARAKVKDVTARAEIEVAGKSRVVAGFAETKGKVMSQISIGASEVPGMSGEQLLSLFAGAKWSAELEGGVGVGADVSAGIFKADANAVIRKKAKVDGEASFGAAFDAARNGSLAPQDLEALRATANAHL